MRSFGVAADDGVLIATCLDKSFARNEPRTREEVWQAVLFTDFRRTRSGLLTVATTMIALLSVLTSTERGSNIMIPISIPTFDGMVFALISLFMVPVPYGYREKCKL